MMAASLNLRRGEPSTRPWAAAVGKWQIASTIIGVTFLAAIGIPLGDKQIFLSIIIPLVFTAAGLCVGSVRLRPSTCVAYALAMSVICAAQILGGGEFSSLSIVLLAALHFPYCVQLTDGQQRSDWALRFFQAVAVVISACGVCQFLGQFVIDYRWLFPIETFLPEGFVMRNYNYFNELYYGSPILKSNGVFMLEASFFSQLAALALIIEIIYFRRLLCCLLFLAAMVVTYSGSGLIVLLVALPIIVVVNRRIDILVYGLVALLAAYLLFNTLGLQLFVQRLGEFGASNSSGFARYVGGFYLFDQYLWPDTANALFGMGAGATDGVVGEQARYAAAAVTWVKVLFEYGLVGAAAYFAFLYFCLLSNRGPLAVKLAAAIMILLNGSLVPFAHALVFALLIWPAGETPQPSTRRKVKTQHARSVAEIA